MTGQIIYWLAMLGALGAPAAFLWFWLFKRETRRALWAIGAIFAIPYFCAVQAFLLEPETLTVRHVTVESPLWTGEPLKIGIITDMHIGGVHMPARRVADVVARMNAQTPDIVVMLGDFANDHAPRESRSAAAQAVLREGIAAFTALQPPLGVYAVIGNHDVWYDSVEVGAELRRANVIVLEDFAVKIPGRSASLVGLNEYSMVRTDYARASATAAAPLIVLSHYPDAIRRVDSRAAITLAGHSHCGQLGIPGLNRLVVASRASRRYLCGLYDVDGKPLYVSGGVGTSILPMRFLRPPEIVILTLRAK